MSLILFISKLLHKLLVNMLSIRVALWEGILLGLVISGNKLILNIALINSSVALCLSGFNKSKLKSPRTSISFLFVVAKILPITFLKISMLDPALYTQLTILFFFFSRQISLICHLSKYFSKCLEKRNGHPCPQSRKPSWSQYILTHKHFTQTITENVVVNQLTSSLNINNCGIHPMQLGFRPNRFTETATLHLIEQVKARWGSWCCISGLPQSIWYCEP